MKELKQKAKVGVAGSFFNQLMSNNSSIPEVGKGATEMLYTDRHVYEVIEVSEDFKTVKLESLNARIGPEYLAALKGKDCFGHQNWVFDKTGHFKTIVYRHGAWRVRQEVVEFTKEFREKATTAALAKSLTPDQFKAVYGNDIMPQNVVDGITKKAIKYHKIRILFGAKNYHYDWSF